MYDLVIIGAAAAGSSAAIYATRRNLNLIMVAKDTGGEVALSGEVENFAGIENITGYELAKKFNDHVRSYHVPIDEGFSVTEIRQEKNYHIVVAKDLVGKEKTYKTKTVIITSGIHPRELGVPGEEQLKSKGITYCTVCDGPLFKDKITATIGAGNAAVESALMMGTIAKKVYLITKYGPDDLNGGFPKAENILLDKVRALPNVEIIHHADTTAILGETTVTGLTYTNSQTKETKELSLQGVMIHIGTVPNSQFVTSCAEKTPAGEIIVDSICRTSCEGVFAAGDVTNIPYKQISIAVGHGATAALSAIDYINRWEA
ncbi:MAG: pyridine nucleotide-disulfide oxidoreductase [Candidatus Magasanikbacteria bacterium CG10_big_fil_rev_8_21_14_0_10_43_6]|uniref:Pyridine nucleotide-disulfide oxidoreductase n=1 Tax=Candidatus Magasanikbacteria bacterium CG10_big_fil_rev_8_21_14_0_10_43_6 TaxID=1974650 RepID=A0A2M6VZX2_9BACT|nr:MAG: pyridine nucleotide-disulfide oxidoreductase [Candidatus Magasanikbacteria bacterium CG10_big_fil_rev_8_21_14_0_10_43_6]